MINDSLKAVSSSQLHPSIIYWWPPLSCSHNNIHIFPCLTATLFGLVTWSHRCWCYLSKPGLMRSSLKWHYLKWLHVILMFDPETLVMWIIFVIWVMTPCPDTASQTLLGHIIAAVSLMFAMRKGNWMMDWWQMCGRKGYFVYYVPRFWIKGVKNKLHTWC